MHEAGVHLDGGVHQVPLEGPQDAQNSVERAAVEAHHVVDFQLVSENVVNGQVTGLDMHPHVSLATPYGHPDRGQQQQYQAIDQVI
jgi:hypothetical protein